MSVTGLNVLMTPNDTNCFGNGSDGDLILAVNETVNVSYPRYFRNVTLNTGATLRPTDRIFVSDTLTLYPGTSINTNGGNGVIPSGGQSFPSFEFGCGGSYGANSVSVGPGITPEFGTVGISNQPTGSQSIVGLPFQQFGGNSSSAETEYDATGAILVTNREIKLQGGQLIPQISNTRFSIIDTFGSNTIPLALTLKSYPFSSIINPDPESSISYYTLANQTLQMGTSPNNFQYVFPKNLAYPLSAYIGASIGGCSGFISAAIPQLTTTTYSASGGGASSCLFISARKIVFVGTSGTTTISANGGDASSYSASGMETLIGNGSGGGGGFVIIITTTPYNTISDYVTITADAGASGLDESTFNPNTAGRANTVGTSVAGYPGNIYYYLITPNSSTAME